MADDRLQKVLASAGIASRRGAEELIAAGRVTVDGRVAQLGDRADPATQAVAVDGRRIGAPAGLRYVALNKPVGVTSTVSDPHAARTVVDMVPRQLAGDARLYPVGRLDADSEGLIILTNDGDWAQRILHPRHEIEREYAAGVDRPLSSPALAALRDGVCWSRPSTASPTSSGTASPSHRAGSARSGGCSGLWACRCAGSRACGSARSGSTICPRVAAAR